MLKVCDSDGFTIYSGFESISYILKGMNRFRVRRNTAVGGPYHVVEHRPSGSTLEPTDAAFVVANFEKSIEHHIGPHYPAHVRSDEDKARVKAAEEQGRPPVLPPESEAILTKRVHYACLKRADGTEKHVIFESGFLCDDAGKTFEVIR